MTALSSPGFSIKRRPGRRLPPRHERVEQASNGGAAGSAPPENPTRRSHEFAQMRATQRSLEALAASEEARSRIGASTESPWNKLRRTMCGPVGLLWSDIEDHGHVTVHIQLSEIFGNDFRPREGIKLVLKTPKGDFALKVDWGMVWVNTPGAGPKDPRSTLFLRTALPPTLIATCEGITAEQCRLLVDMRGESRVWEMTLNVLGPTLRCF